MEKKKENIGVYFKTLFLKNIRCFKGENSINFSNNSNSFAQWTVILGNNNTGKTTILKSLCLNDFLSSGNKAIDDKFAEEQFNEFNKLDYAIVLECINETLIVSSEGRMSVWDPDFLIKESNSRELKKGEKYLSLDAYGINRKPSPITLSESQHQSSTATLYDGDLIDTEEWLLQLDYAQKNGRKDANRKLDKIKEILTSSLLPDIQDFRFVTNDELKSFVEFQTDYGWVRLKDLGYGYQSTMAWVMDLAKRLFDRYPDSENPLAEPAVVLVDEIDLHLHPEWQRKIIGYLSNIFKKTQFIVTAHSPLLVQSAEEVNLVMLEKDGDRISIRQEFDTFQGWTVDEILTELMGLKEKTLSDTYLKWMKQFDEALDEENAEKANEAYEALDKILHPTSSQRKLMRIQMSSLVSA
ncbi:MAG: ATP-binding protein [Spirosomataceae bacterium]